MENNKKTLIIFLFFLIPIMIIKMVFSSWLLLPMCKLMPGLDLISAVILVNMEIKHGMLYGTVK